MLINNIYIYIYVNSKHFSSVFYISIHLLYLHSSLYISLLQGTHFRLISIMRSFYVLIQLSFFVTLCCSCNKRTANVRITNKSGKKILTGTLIHRYSDEYTNKMNFINIENGETSRDVLSVDYHTGAFCTGADWWLLDWVAEDGTTYSSDPKNGQCVISVIAETVASLLVALSIHTSSVTSALLDLTSKIANAVAETSNSDHCGLKQCTLKADDAGKTVNIELYSYTANGVKIDPAVSSSCTTDYELLKTCPGFAQISDWDLHGNDLQGIVNPSQAPSKEACCTQCYMNSQCHSYTWNSVNKNCYFKDYSNGRGVANNIAHSGIRQSKKSILYSIFF